MKGREREREKEAFYGFKNNENEKKIDIFS
jgi:hypothetical protein